ncbi:MAG TPA: hypothetical protein VGJ73_00145 [Verrucomicrobiae bacterium]|jgi:hypothetical protein
MRERPEQIIKFVSIGLGALLFIQFIRIIWTANPLAHVVVPDLPSLADESPAVSETNASASMNPKEQVGSNRGIVKTNSATALESGSKTALSGTNGNPSQVGIGTNLDKSADKPVSLLAEGASSNSPGAGVSKHKRHGRFGGDMAMGSMPGAKKTTVTPAVQASIDRIIDSEILGPVIRPLPMALLGIAGAEAFLRGPDGQTGLVKEGDALGDIKLLRIGTNRVLIEEDGQKKELTIFDGIGGETLLEKSSRDSNEHNKP